MSMEVPAALDAVEHAYDRATLDALTAAADQAVAAGHVAPRRPRARQGNLPRPSARSRPRPPT